ncbi:hypothetical protein GEMRC1_006130 [Eukaryota sp. GEM-RC1]
MDTLIDFSDPNNLWHENDAVYKSTVTVLLEPPKNPFHTDFAAHLEQQQHQRQAVPLSALIPTSEQPKTTVRKRKVVVSGQSKPDLGNLSYAQKDEIHKRKVVPETPPEEPKKKKNHSNH